MYEAFYGLREKPFNLTPDPRFLYLSEKHKEAFAHLMYGIKNRSGFVMVTGEIGTGKTTICRTLLNQLDENTEVAFIFNPYLSPEELLLKINEDFGIRSMADSVLGLIDELNAYLLDQNARGKNCVLVIDEAQNLTPGVLEQIRLLSNLETETTKLLQIVLIGQPELMQHLSLDELRQLNQRITARYHLQPLDRHETLQYIAYRLRVAGGRRRIQFTPGAVKLVYRYSGGTPRVINAICDRALLIGYTREVREITATIVHKAWREVQGERPSAKKPPLLKRLIPSPTVLATVALLAVAGMFAFEYASGQPRPWGETKGGFTAWMAGLSPFADGSHTAEARGRDAVTADPVVTPAVERPVQADAPPGADEFDPSFAGLIDRMNPMTCRNAAALGMLRAWNLALLTEYPADDSVESLREFAQNSRLLCEEMPLTLEQFEAINLPALLRLHGKHQAIWSAVTKVEFDEYRITTGMSETTLVPRDALALCYQNEALVFWRDPMPDAPILRVTSKGEDVRVLQVQLRALGRLDRKPSGTFDTATERAVKELQTETGLTSDGVLGPQTRMVLYSWLPGFVTPALRSLPPLLLTSNHEEDEPAPKKPVKTVAKSMPPPTPAAAAPPQPEPPQVEAAKEPGDVPEATEAQSDISADTAAVTPLPEAISPASLPIPQGPPDPFASLDSATAVTTEELAQPPVGPKPDNATDKVTDAPSKFIPTEQTEKTVKESSPSSEGAAPTTTATPSPVGGMPLVPSSTNSAVETTKR